MKASAILFLLLVPLSGCHKDKTAKGNSGEYEWMQSYKGIGNTHSFDSEGNRYGVRVLKKGVYQFFKNGKKVKVETEGTGFGVKGYILETTSYPYRDYTNQYKKVK